MVEALLISNIVLWIVVVIMALLIFALVRQVGVLYERVAPAGALMLNSRLKVGDQAPELELIDLEGSRLTVGGVSSAGKCTLLFFVSPTCPVCKTLLPIVKSAGKSERAWLEVILASDGTDQDHKGYVKAQGLHDLPYISSELLGRSYGVSKLPYAVLIDEGGRISSMGIVNSREHLESLFESRERGVASIQDFMQQRAGGHQGDRPATDSGPGSAS